MRKKLAVSLYVNNVLLILFYVVCADMPLAPLWGMTYLVFLIVSATMLIDAAAMKRMNLRFAARCFLYVLFATSILAIVFYAMTSSLNLAARTAACAVAALFSFFHAKVSTSLACADEKYIRKTDELTQEALREYMMESLLGKPHINFDNRVRITVLNLITALFSVTLLFLGVSFRQSWLCCTLFFCLSLAFLYFSRLKYCAAGSRRIRAFMDILLAFGAVCLLILQRIVSPDSVNFALIVASCLLMCPYWLTAHDLICRFQLGWKLAE